MYRRAIREVIDSLAFIYNCYTKTYEIHVFTGHENLPLGLFFFCEKLFPEFAKLRVASIGE